MAQERVLVCAAKAAVYGQGVSEMNRLEMAQYIVDEYREYADGQYVGRKVVAVDFPDQWKAQIHFEDGDSFGVLGRFRYDLKNAPEN